MKKMLSCLLCLCLLLSCAGALAEEASQAALQKAFQEKAFDMLADLPDTNALTFTLTPDEGQPFTAVLQAPEDVVDLTLNIPGQDQPIIIQLAEPSTIYFSVDGQAYALDIEALANSLAALYVTPQVDEKTIEELSQLLLMDTLLPHIAVETSEDSQTARVDVAVTVKELLQGVALFGDQVVSNERYLNAVAALASRSLAQQGMTGDPKEIILAYWPQLKDELQAIESDGALEIHGVSRQVGTASLIAGNAVYTEGEQRIAAALTAADSRAAFTLSLTLNQGPEKQEAQLAKLSIQADKDLGNLSASLALNGQEEYALTGQFAKGQLQCQLSHLRYGVLQWLADVQAIETDDVVTATAAISYDRSMGFRTWSTVETVTASLYWSPYKKTFTLSNKGETLALSLDTDDQGRFSAAIQGPDDAFALTADGILAGNSLHAQIACEADGKKAFDAGVTAAWADQTLTLRGEINSTSVTGGLEAFFSPALANISWRSANDMGSATLQRDGASPSIIRAKVQSRYGGFTAEYDGSTFTYQQAGQTVTVEPYFESDSVHVIRIVTTARATKQAHRAVIRTTLSETETGWRMESNVISEGERVAQATLVSAPAPGFTRLSEQNPTIIDLPFLQMYFAQMAAESIPDQQ
ncbi:MAG: hypothetical protein IJ189_08685 [Clostridia bacterium]|nr:hypothetical protein [Clostridia bacterium]